MSEPYAKPFLKWAGGKTQLIAEIARNLPRAIASEKFVYVEPFVGSGAIFFWMLNSFPNLEKAVINDVNADLINVYQTIAREPQRLISILKEFQTEFYRLQADEAAKKTYYYAKRDCYNARDSDAATHAALFIFLNRTCFNGLYRVNRGNSFNVPMGSYKFPKICDEANILAASRALQTIEIVNGDFEKTIEFANENSFYYFDPPYKPVSATASFNSYAKVEFDDAEQIRLRDICVSLVGSVRQNVSLWN